MHLTSPALGLRPGDPLAALALRLTHPARRSGAAPSQRRAPGAHRSRCFWLPNADTHCGLCDRSASQLACIENRACTGCGRSL